jgi:hypothetical protein
MKIFGYEPAIWLYGINSGVALLVAYGLPLSQTQVAAVTVIATAFLTVLTAALTRPVDVSALTAAVGTGLAAAAAFGLNLSADQIGTTVAVGSIVLALVLRSNVSPAPAAVANRP